MVKEKAKAKGKASRNPTTDLRAISTHTRHYLTTHSNEISLLFHPEEQNFGRKLRKYHSILAGEASAKFSILLGDIAVFDCRISQLPNIEDRILEGMFER